MTQKTQLNISLTLNICLCFALVSLVLMTLQAAKTKTMPQKPISYARVYEMGQESQKNTIINQYNAGYRAGMLYAYDNVVVCGASPEEEGEFLAQKMRELGELDETPTTCGE